MSIQGNAFMPKMKRVFDPKEEARNPAVDWEEKAAQVEAQKRYELAQRELHDLKAPAAPPVVPESPFKITGGINLGNYDLQQQSREAAARVKEIEDKYEQRMAELADQGDHYRDELNNLRLEKMQEMFNAQIQSLSSQLQSGGNRLDLAGQISQIKEMAGMLGFQTATPAITDSNLQLQMLKMQNDAAREEREFQWKMRQDEWSREQKKEELKISGIVATEKIKAERERNQMLASFPETLGMAIARGLTSGSLGSAAPAPPAPVPEPRVAAPAPPSSPPAPPASQPAGQHIEAGVGEAGETSCPACGGIIAIAPNTTTAVCASCGAQIPVKRMVQSGE